MEKPNNTVCCIWIRRNQNQDVRMVALSHRNAGNPKEIWSERCPTRATKQMESQ